MGFLRKIGRKVKKGVKKLFSTKLGRIAGSIGLYLVMGAAAKSLSGWAQSTFGQAAAQTGTQAATEAAVQAGTEAAVQAGTDVVSRDIAGKVMNASTNSEAANITFNQIDNLVKEGSSDLIMKNNVTDAVSDISKQILDPISTKDLLGTGKQETRIFSDLTFEEKMKQVGADTVQFAKETFIPEDTGDFISTAARSALEYSLQEEPEEPFISAGVAPRPQTQPAQSAYIADVGQQYMAANNTTKLPDFNQIMQQNMYGTGTPQYFQQLYQPEMLPLPQA